MNDYITLTRTLREQGMGFYAFLNSFPEYSLERLPFARACTEYLLKSIVVFHCELTTANREIKNINSKIPGALASGDTMFALDVCIKVVLHLDKTITVSDKEFNTFKKQTNFVMHGGCLLTDVEIIEANTIFEKFIGWFLQKYSSENWKDYVNKKIKENTDVRDNEIKLLLLEYIKQNTKIQDENIVHINSEYWEVLRKKHESKKENVYERILLSAAENYTHSFIALETEVNPNFCDHLLTDQYKVKTEFSKNEEESFDAVLQVALKSNVPSLIKIFAKSGEGKTMLLGKIAYKYSQDDSAFDLYELTDFTDGVVNQLRERILNSEKSVVVLIDTPSKYETNFIKGWDKILKAHNGTPLVVVITDQRFRYKEKLLRPEFVPGLDSLFSLEYEFEFLMTEQERSNLLRLFIQVLQSKRMDISAERVRALFNWNHKLNARERMYQIVKSSDIRVKLRHQFDWEIYAGATSVGDLKKYEPLFLFVALFSYFNIGVPLGIFGTRYFEGTSKIEALRFLKNNQDVIQVSGEKLELRHEQIAKWYFEIEENKRDALDLLKVFFEIFQSTLDQVGCYLFRNVHRMIFRSFLKDAMLIDNRKEIFMRYVELTKATDENRIDLAKVMMELTTIEPELSKKHIWLDKIIKMNDDDLHARTKKIGLFIKTGDYISARLILHTLKKKGLYDANVIAHELTLNKSLNAVEFLDIDSDDFNKEILLLTARGKAKQGRYEEAFNIYDALNYIPVEPQLQMVYARFYVIKKKYTQAIGMLNEILKVSNSIPVAFLFHEIYVKTANYYWAEKVLIDICNSESNQTSPYVLLAKLYRNKGFEHYDGERAYYKAKSLFEKRHELPMLMQSKQFRTEYAKWCYDKHPKENEKHSEAINIYNETIERIDSNHVYSYTELGRIFQHSPFFLNIDKAIEVLERGLKISMCENDTAIRTVLVGAYLKKPTKENLHKAYHYLKEVEQKKPNHLPFLFALRRYYTVIGDEGRVAEITIQIVEKESENTGAIINKAIKLMKRGEYDLALASVDDKLNEESANTYLLNLAANILLHKAEITPIDNGNELIERAVRYLDNSNKELPATMHLLIRAADLYVIPSEEWQAHKAKADFRNSKVAELFASDSSNVYLFSSLCKIFTRCRRPRVIIALSKLIKYHDLTPEDKLFFLIEKRNLYNILKETDEVRLIDEEVVAITKSNHKLARRALRAYSTFEVQESNCISGKNWNIGRINFFEKSIEIKDTKIKLADKYKVQRNVNNDDKVYFSIITSNEVEYADYIEPYFEKKNLLEKFVQYLPRKLNQIARRPKA